MRCAGLFLLLGILAINSRGQSNGTAPTSSNGTVHQDIESAIGDKNGTISVSRFYEVSLVIRKIRDMNLTIFLAC